MAQLAPGYYYWYLDPEKTSAMTWIFPAPPRNLHCMNSAIGWPYVAGFLPIRKDIRHDVNIGDPLSIDHHCAVEEPLMIKVDRTAEGVYTITAQIPKNPAFATSNLTTYMLEVYNVWGCQPGDYMGAAWIPVSDSDSIPCHYKTLSTFGIGPNAVSGGFFVARLADSRVTEQAILVPTNFLLNSDNLWSCYKTDLAKYRNARIAQFSVDVAKNGTPTQPCGIGSVDMTNLKVGNLFVPVDKYSCDALGNCVQDVVNGVPLTSCNCWECDTNIGSCSLAGAGEFGGYKTGAECQPKCGTTTTSYWCEDGNCVQAPAGQGQYAAGECKCYNCVGTTCSKVPDHTPGSITQSQCSTCTSAKTHSCIGGNCLPVPLGQTGQFPAGACTCYNCDMSLAATFRVYEWEDVTTAHLGYDSKTKLVMWYTHDQGPAVTISPHPADPSTYALQFTYLVPDPNDPFVLPGETYNVVESETGCTTPGTVLPATGLQAGMGWEPAKFVIRTTTGAPVTGPLPPGNYILSIGEKLLTRSDPSIVESPAVMYPQGSGPCNAQFVQTHTIVRTNGCSAVADGKIGKFTNAGCQIACAPVQPNEYWCGGADGTVCEKAPAGQGLFPVGQCVCYKCDTGTHTCSGALDTHKGTFADSDICKIACQVQPDKYLCNAQNQCIKDPLGSYTTSNCDGKCGAPPSPKYECNAQNQCVVSATGPYTTSNCDGKCVPAAQMYACAGQQCVKSATGTYSTSTCNNRCNPTPSGGGGLPTWAIVTIVGVVVLIIIIILALTLPKAIANAKAKKLAATTKQS